MNMDVVTLDLLVLSWIMFVGYSVLLAADSPV